MKSLLNGLSFVAVALASNVAFAQPVALTSSDMDQFTAGFNMPGNNTSSVTAQSGGTAGTAGKFTIASVQTSAYASNGIGISSSASLAGAIGVSSNNAAAAQATSYAVVTVAH
jgi:hypothetical protein